ncbi:MAG: hypothetical protein ACO3G4_12910, partial [Opitutaceae bacterium]
SSPMMLLLPPRRAGCAGADAAGQAVQRRLQEPALERVVPGVPRDVYGPLRTAVTRLGYRVVRGSGAQGELEAVSPVGAGADPGSARQLVLRIRLTPTAAGTMVRIRVAEVREADSSRRAGYATEVPWPPGPRHEALLAELGRELAAQKSR